MEICGNCGKKLSKDSTFCEYCGESTKNKCEKCGEKLLKENKFCTNCGAINSNYKINATSIPATKIEKKSHTGIIVAIVIGVIIILGAICFIASSIMDENAAIAQAQAQQQYNNSFRGTVNNAIGSLTGDTNNDSQQNNNSNYSQQNSNGYYN